MARYRTHSIEFSGRLRRSHASSLALTSEVISNWTGRPVFCWTYCRPGSDLWSGDHIADPDLDQVTAAKLAVDCQIEQRSVANASSIFGIRLRARGQIGILGAIVVQALLLAYPVGVSRRESMTHKVTKRLDRIAKCPP